MASEGKDRKRKAAPAVVNTTVDPPSKKTRKGSTKTTESPAGISIVSTTRPRTRSTKETPVEKTDSRKQTAEEEAARVHAPTDAKLREHAVDLSSGGNEKEGGVAVPRTVSADSSKNEKRKSNPKAVDGDEITARLEDSETDAPEEDDQTSALLKGFESEGDDDDNSGDEGFRKGQDLPSIPDYKKTNKRLRSAAKSASEHTPGVVYVGRIPHGFYENEMRAYFTQFGNITRLRLSRNRRTGKSKHYAFIEFSSAAVAKIVAETMDNYLMFGHILKCKFVPAEHLHAEIWKGANRRFKKTPWNKIERSNLVQGKTREQWDKKAEKEQEKRKAKADKLKEIGYEYSLPELKHVTTVPVQESTSGPAPGTKPKIHGSSPDTAVDAFLDRLDAPVATELLIKSLAKEQKVGITNSEEASSGSLEKTVKKSQKSKKNFKDGAQLASVSVRGKTELKISKKASA